VKFEVLRDAERLFGASPSLRAQAASSVVEALEGAFEPLALERMLLRHSSTGLPFVIVPGGTFSMGLTERDIAEVHSNFEIASPLCEWLERAVRCASPTRTVEVAPFLCAAAPLATDDVARLTSTASEGDTFCHEQARALVAELGFRLPSEAELEWLRRDGAARSFTLDVVAHPERALRGTLTSRFGVLGLLLQEWAADDWHDDYNGAPTTSEAWLGGDAAGVYRGGPFLPVQSQSELLEFLAGLRCYGKDEEGFTPDVMARPALSL